MASVIESDSKLEQLDRELCALTREHGQIIMLDEFRRQLDHAPDRQRVDRPSSEQPIPSTAEVLKEAQLRQELALAYHDLGAETFALAHHGALNYKRLAPRIRQIHDLYAQLTALDQAAC